MSFLQRKIHQFWWASQTNFGPSYFVRALAIHQWRSTMFVTWVLLPGNPAFFFLFAFLFGETNLFDEVSSEWHERGGHTVLKLFLKHTINIFITLIYEICFWFKSVIKYDKNKYQKSKDKNVFSEFISIHYNCGQRLLWSSILIL